MEEFREILAQFDSAYQPQPFLRELTREQKIRLYEKEIAEIATSSIPRARAVNLVYSMILDGLKREDSDTRGLYESKDLVMALGNEKPTFGILS